MGSVLSSEIDEETIAHICFMKKLEDAQLTAMAVQERCEEISSHLKIIVSFDSAFLQYFV